MPFVTTTISTGQTEGSTVAGSTTPNAGKAIGLNYIGGKPTTVSVTWAASATVGNAQIQYTLDDIQSTSAKWLPVVSSAGSSTAGSYAAATFFDTGYTVAFLNPIAGVRLFSSAITAGSTQVITMKVVQGDGW